MKKNLTKSLAAIAIFAALTPSESFACACGCSLFDVGTSSLLPSAQGGLAFIEYDNILQNKNWHNNSSANKDDNELKKIDSQIVTVGGQYMFNRKWGIMAKVPYVMRSVKSAGEHDEDHEEDAAITTTNRNSLGDVKINGIYSGFFSDMSTGITFGLKLPTGANKQSGFDKDTQIGTGSVDAILGAYHLGRFNFDGSFGWFTQANWQKPIITKSDFHPGDEISGSIGSYYSLGKVGSLSKVSPMLQIIATKKTRDSGVASDNANSGYSRAFIAPGVEINIAQFKIYSDIELPIYEQVNGYQLAVGKVLKVIVGYRF